MKFVCDQCKAKYQISDDKVAGKTVKMKCRKCGHMIEVRAAVTETSVATSAPNKEAADEKSGPHAAGSGSDKDKPGGAAGPHKPPAPGAPPPRPGQLKVSPLATSLASARPAAPRAQPANAGGSGGTQGPQGQGALAGAFSRTVERTDETSQSSFDMRELSTADEWYAAINGVPVGPVRIAELRRKAALGAVTEDSLVWQEGLEEWRPVRAFPELAEMVREALASGRASVLPPSVTTELALTPGQGPSGPQPVRPSARPSAPPRAPSVPARPNAPLGPKPMSNASHAHAVHNNASHAGHTVNNVIPFGPRLATAERLDEQVLGRPDPKAPPAPSLADPFALPPPPAVPSPLGFDFGGLSATAPLAVAASTATASPSVAPSSAPASFEDSKSRESKKPSPVIRQGVIAVCVAFGVTLAITFARSLDRKPAAPAPAPAPSERIVYVERPAPVPSASADVTPPAPSASASTGGGGGTRSGGGNASAKAAAPQGPKGYDLNGLGLGGSSGPGGPSMGGGGGGGGGGGASLSQGQVEAVVRSRQIGIKRACWEKAEGSAPSVKVTAHVTIAPSGLVQSVSASGNDLAIAGCIESSLRKWTFPAAGGPTTIDIPFAFVRQ